MRTGLTVIAFAALSCAAPTASLAADPSTLTKTQAIQHVRTAIKTEFSAQLDTRPSCSRVSRLRFSCVGRWVAGPRSFRAIVTVVRTGLPTSPIDSYRIKATSGGRYLTPGRETKTGRIIVKTRPARLGQTLRLLGYDFGVHEEIEITPGVFTDPFVSTNEFLQPAPGTRFISVTATVRNVGQGRYDRGLSNGKLITAANVTITSAITVGCEGNLDVPAGEERIACVAFEVPFNTGIRQFEYSAGRETGAWRP